MSVCLCVCVSVCSSVIVVNKRVHIVVYMHVTVIFIFKTINDKFINSYTNDNVKRDMGTRPMPATDTSTHMVIK